MSFKFITIKCNLLLVVAPLLFIHEHQVQKILYREALANIAA
jgi:hypothetical protein